MRFLRLLVTASAALAPALLASGAHAAVTVTPGNPEWSARRDNSNLQLNQINQADCLAADVTITFDVSIENASSNQLFEVWAGTGCGDKTSRDENANCVKVASGDPDSGDISVLVKDILQPTGTDGLGEGTGTNDTCTSTSSGTGETTRSLFFLILDSGSLATQGTPGQWDFTYDLIPPDPPTDVTAGPGENSLTLDFTASEDDDLDRYRFYCSQEEAATVDSCTSTVLVPGKTPAGLKDCGSTSATAKTSGETNDKLTNGLNYAVAIAAEDKLGNVGVLSNISCAQPQEVTGYFEAYRAAGGQAGGGFCSFAPARRGALPTLAALVFGFVALARRRR